MLNERFGYLHGVPESKRSDRVFLFYFFGNITPRTRWELYDTKCSLCSSLDYEMVHKAGV